MRINTRYTYDFMMRLLHWGMGIMFIAMLALGFCMGGIEAPLKWKLYSLHKSCGVTFIVLIIFRLFWRLTHKPSHLTHSNILNILSSMGVLWLYVGMLAMVMSGYVMSAAGGYPIEWFGLVKLPLLFEANKQLSSLARNIHAWGGISLACLIGVHILAAFYHHFIRKDRVLLAMLGR